jgi:NAD(P)-dependent dehydrogenase (short-subunit alcohol dehydrogenase family)
MKLVLDVTQEDDWGAVIAQVQRTVGVVDILFNNAGITQRGTIEDTDRALWEHVLLVDLTSVYLGSRAVIVGMLTKGRAAIVNNASINGLIGNTGLIAYTAAKSGVVGRTRALAVFLASQELSHRTGYPR